MERKIKFPDSVPANWTKEEIERYYNNGSWCSDNLFDRMKALVPRKGDCLCHAEDNIEYTVTYITP